MVGKAGERCRGGQGLPDTLEMWKARALAFREHTDELQADNGRLLGRIKSLENDLEQALASVGAFRAAIEDVWARSAGESGEDGFVVSYVIPVGVLHRAIGMARGTDAGGKLLAERDTYEAMLNAIWATAGGPEGLSPLQAVERLVKASS